MVLGYFTGCFSTHTKDSSSRKLSPSLGDFLWACFQRYKCSNSSIFNFNFSHNWLIRVQICFLSKWRKALFRSTDLILASFRLAGTLWEKRKKSSPFIYLNGPRWSTQSGWQRTKRTACQKSWIRAKLLLQSNITSTDKVEKSTFANRKAYFSCLWWRLSRRKHFSCITHPLSGTAVQWQKNEPNMALISGESRLSRTNKL